MTDCTIWHNPRCSKSRQTLALLKDKGIEPTVVEYLKNPPSKADLVAALQLLGMEPFALMRKGEKIFKELKIDAKSSSDVCIGAMLEYPVLIERPIVFCNSSAAIGRPPENVLKIL